MSNRIPSLKQIINQVNPPTTLINYYNEGSGVGRVTTSNRRALRNRASWRPTKNGGATSCVGFCPNYPCPGSFITLSTGFNNNINLQAGKNKIFSSIGKDVEIISSPISWQPGNTGGFYSLASPNPQPTYLSYSKTGTIDSLQFDTGTLYTQGRYIKSKTIVELDLPAAPGWNHTKGTWDYSIKKYITSWNNLQNIIIEWIAGSGNNGGDTPDVHEWLAGGYKRLSEDLVIEFYDASNSQIGSDIKIWQTKRQPTIQERIHANSLGISPYDATTFNNPLQVYGSWPTLQGSTPIQQKNTKGQFWSQFSLDTTGLDLSQAHYFVIRQTRHTWVLDNYGIRSVQLTFAYPC